jgi:putative membrane protein
MPDLDKSPSASSPSAPKQGINLSPRAIVGIAIAVVCLIFVFSNTEEATLSFLWLDITASGWLFLFVLLALGFLAGFLIGRNRYKGKQR